MASSWKIAALGALAGAALAVFIVYAAALTGRFPASDAPLHDYIVNHPQVVAEAVARYQQDQDDEQDRAQQAAVTKLGEKAFFDPKLAFVTGHSGAKTTFVEFFDYNCVHCRNSVSAVQKFYDRQKDKARFAFFELPIFGKDSEFAARAAIAARRQPDKYIPFHFAMMTQDGQIDPDSVMADAQKVGIDMGKLKTDMADPAIAATLEKTRLLAHTALVQGTPEFIVDGKSRNGEIDEQILNQMLKPGVTRS